MTRLLIKLFIKDYDNIKDTKVRGNYGFFASIVGIITNTILFGLKLSIGLIFNSVSVTADAVNNLTDSTSSLITLFGFKISGKPADEEHPYGHARAEYIAGLIVSFIIVFLGLQLVKSSFMRIIQPEEAEFNFISIIALVIAIGIKLWQYIFYKKISVIINSQTIMATAIDSRNDSISTLAVLIGAIINYYTSLNLDGYIGLIVAILIIVSGVNLVKETINPLLGNAPSKEIVEEIHDKILSYEGIIGLHDLHVHNYGEGQLFCSVHCEVAADVDIMISHEIVDNIERDCKLSGINLVIHLDPIVSDDERTNRLKNKVENSIKDISENLSIDDFRVIWGVSNSSLIFDLNVPLEFKYEDEELIGIIHKKVLDINKNYRIMITIKYEEPPTSDLKE